MKTKLSIKEELLQEQAINENAFMPEEFDDAFVGFDMSYTSQDNPVYNVDKFGDRVFPETPEGMIEPRFINNITEEEFISQIVPTLPYEDERYAKAVIGIMNGNVAVYDYDKYVETMAEIFQEQDKNAEPGDFVLSEDTDDFEEYLTQAREDVGFNALRDYVDHSKMIVENVDYMISSRSDNENEE